MKFEVTLSLTNEGVDDTTIDSLVIQLNEIVAAAVEEKQIEIPNAEIIDYEVGRFYEW